MRALFISFPASNYEESKEFYEVTVGLRAVKVHAGDPHRLTNYDLGGKVLKLYEWKDEYFGSGHSGLFIETDDLDAAVERIRRSNGKTTEIEIHSWGGRCCSVTDPFGNIFDLIDTNQKGLS